MKTGKRRQKAVARQVEGMNNIGLARPDYSRHSPGLDQIAQLSDPLESADISDAGAVDRRRPKTDDFAIVPQSREVLDPAPCMDIRRVGEIEELHSRRF